MSQKTCKVIQVVNSVKEQGFKIKELAIESDENSENDDDD